MKYVGLADCNTFYASCERIFRPDLYNRPIVVLSNNDGCIVALSKEAKALGIKRGTPYFKAKEDLEKNAVAVFSSNYTLYQDISDRISDMLGLLATDIEKYSIDESFFSLGDISDDLAQQECTRLVHYLKKGIGIPVSIGMARTKTLAKIANHIAKKGNLSYLLLPYEEEKVLKQTPIDDIWGLGYRGAAKAVKMGLSNAWEFANLEDEVLLKNFTVTGYNTARELLGTKMIGKEKPAHLSLSSSISFAQPVSLYSDMEIAVACHCSCVCSKLVANKHKAKFVALQILTNRFKEDFSDTSGYAELESPTAYLPNITKAALSVLKAIFKENMQYKAVRVIVWDLSPGSYNQFSLFDNVRKIETEQKKDRLMETVNKNKNIKIGTCCSVKKNELASFKFLSPKYTTRWEDLPACR